MANHLSSKNAEQQAADNLKGGGTLTGRVITRADNNPPNLVALLLDQLTETYALEFAKVDPIRARANAMEQKIETDEQLSAWGAIYTDAKALLDALDTARKNEKRPFTDTVDTTFNNQTAPLATIMQWVRGRADHYNRQKVLKQRADEAARRAKLEQEEAAAREKARELAEFGETDKAIEEVRKATEIEQPPEPMKAADATRVRSSGGVASASAVWKFRIDDYAKVDLNALRLIIPRAAVEKAIAAVVKQQKGDTKIDGVTVYEDVGTSFRK